MNSTITRARYSHIDLIESIAILFVVFYHFFPVSNAILTSSSVTAYLLYAARAILSTAVPLFFFVNGYLLLNKEFHLKKHILKTVRFFALTMLWAAFSLLFLMMVRQDFFALEDLIRALFTFPTGWINYLWYMGALIVLYLFFPILKPTFDHNKGAILYFTGIAFFFTFGNPLLNMLTSMQQGQMTHYNFFSFFHPLQGIRGYSLVYFLLGGLAGYYEKGICLFLSEKLSHPRLTAFVLLVLSTAGLTLYGIAFSFRSGAVLDTVWHGYDTVFTLINTLCIYYLSQGYRKDFPLIRTISQNTFGIYLLHMLVIDVVHVAMSSFAPSLPNVFPVNLLLYILIVFVSLSLSLLIKQLPFFKHFI